ncbi:hypothetical protein Tco_0910132 [Tanacetum coccineum]|uniref:Reverse transcriptase domain-containing protein n=1 Tax=Tanacetum coccineum TaxID=301880 RepID=A0ABQ5CTV3_9ASTR
MTSRNRDVQGEDIREIITARVRKGGNGSSIRKWGSLPKNDDEVHGSKGVISLQHYPWTYRNERARDSVIHNSRYDEPDNKGRSKKYGRTNRKILQRRKYSSTLPSWSRSSTEKEIFRHGKEPDGDEGGRRIDYYPLLEIDMKIKAVMGFPFKCFLDAYKGYHQIQMSEEDDKKTALYTDQGTYCYTKMPFGLKQKQKAYVDDMVIKSKTEQEMILDIAETFDNLRRVNMKSNSRKCSFSVEEGKFLGYMVTSEGIRANPKKTKAVADIQSPKTLKEMQSLSRKLAALNHFLSRSAERALPFFKTLKNITKENKDDYQWMEEAERAFQEIKKLILELPTLTT